MSTINNLARIAPHARITESAASSNEQENKPKKKKSLLSRLRTKLISKKSNTSSKNNQQGELKPSSVLPTNNEVERPNQDSSEDEEALEKVLEMISKVEETSLNRTEDMKKLLNESKDNGIKTSEVDFGSRSI